MVEDYMSRLYTRKQQNNVQQVPQNNVQPQQLQQHSQNEIVMSATAKRNLDAIKKERAKRQQYIPMDSGVTHRLQFDPEKVAPEEKIFNGKATQRVAYKVIDMANPEAGEKTLSLTYNQSQGIEEALEDNYRILDITKVGEGFSIRYEVNAIE